MLSSQHVQTSELKIMASELKIMTSELKIMASSHINVKKRDNVRASE